jgi:REP-associated tyrosine transposase
MILNRMGQIAHTEWNKTPDIRPNVLLDEFVIMPNHLHGILVIDYPMKNENTDDGRGVMHYAPTDNPQLESPSQTIGAIVRGFKSTATKQINILRKTPAQPVWQRNYFERVIRNDKELFNIHQYIINNPLKWAIDNENPINWEIAK